MDEEQANRYNRLRQEREGVWYEQEKSELHPWDVNWVLGYLEAHQKHYMAQVVRKLADIAGIKHD
jgi:hypothetical protein